PRRLSLPSATGYFVGHRPTLLFRWAALSAPSELPARRVLPSLFRLLRSGAVGVLASFRPAQRILQPGHLLPETRIALRAVRPAVERHHPTTAVSPHRYGRRDRSCLCSLPPAEHRVHAAHQGSARSIAVQAGPSPEIWRIGLPVRCNHSP